MLINTYAFVSRNTFMFPQEKVFYYIIFIGFDYHIVLAETDGQNCVPTLRRLREEYVKLSSNFASSFFLSHGGN